MNSRELWAQGLSTVGAVGMIIGAIDPMEGSVVILAGSGCMALGAAIGRTSRAATRYRVLVLALIVIGVGALWGMSTVGGVGGESGHSMWWALLIVPYLVGWVMGILGPDSPRWMWWAGGVVGVWYLVMPILMLRRAAREPALMTAPVVMAVVGLATLIGCYLRLRQPPHAPTPRPPFSHPVAPNT